MKRQSLAIAGMLGMLVLSGLLDVWYRQAQVAAGRSFDFAPLLLLRMGTLLVFAAAILAMAWAILVRTDRSILISSVYVLVGLIVVASPAIPGLASISWALKIDIPHAIVEAPTGLTMGLTGAFIAVIGLTGLVLRGAPGILPAPAHHNPTADTASRAL